MVPCESTAEEVSFEWSHHTILPTDSEVRITSMSPCTTDPGSERDNLLMIEKFIFLAWC